MVETINAVCPACKKTFAVPAEYEDRKVKCKCGQVFIAAKKLTEPKEPVSIESARGKPSHNKSVIVLGVIAVSLTLIVSVFLMWLFVFRDRWENDNGPKIRQEADTLAKLQTLESKAQSFIENGDLQNGIAKYQEALDFIQKYQTNNPKFTEAMGRISLAKREATELVEQVNRKREEEQKLEEQKQRLANMRTTVKGGAWITRKAGNSEPVRGLNIFAVKSAAKNEQRIAMLHATLKGDEERLRQAKDEVAEFEQLDEDLKKKMDASKDPELMEKGIDLLIKILSGKIAAQKRVDTLEPILKRTEALIEVVSKANSSVRVDLKFIFSVVSVNAGEEENATWASICSQQLVGETHTDVDGKYSIELPGGEYYLYAMFDSSYSRIEWLVPIRVGEAKDISVDLHNENAFRITNKNE